MILQFDLHKVVQYCTLYIIVALNENIVNDNSLNACSLGNCIRFEYLLSAVYTKQANIG